MNFFLSFFFAANLLHVFGFDWAVPDRADWTTSPEGGQQVLTLKNGKEPPASGPRRPFQFAVAETSGYSKVDVEADVQPLGKSLMIVFAYRDAAHFNYAHLSVDTATKEPHHNGIFHVYGGERVRISPETGPAAFPEGRHWYHVLLSEGGASGGVKVSVDGKPVPALRAVDLSLTSGRVGLGSFDETAEFKNVRITGRD